tara:strand:- start:394 stop:1158 length:765 start_codon:yes stop_codon:yes gene_type:complete
MLRFRPWGRFWSPVWNRRSGFRGNQLIIEVFLIGAIFVAVPYFLTNNIANAYLTTVFDPELSIDRQIPVLAWTILPYTLLYAFYPAVLLVCPKNDRGYCELVVFMQGLIMATLLCCVIFVVLPAEIDLRDQINWDSMNGWETYLFDFIHMSDNPWNAWPSLHIVHSYLLARAMTVWALRKRSTSPIAWNIFLVILWVEWILLSISILTTKQHFLFDLVTGIIFAHVFWLALQKTLSEINDLGPNQFAREYGWTD